MSQTNSRIFTINCYDRTRNHAELAAIQEPLENILTELPIGYPNRKIHAVQNVKEALTIALRELEK